MKTCAKCHALLPADWHYGDYCLTCQREDRDKGVGLPPNTWDEDSHTGDKEMDGE
jgi:hypothetical protein